MSHVSREKSVRGLLKAGIARLRDAQVSSFTLATEMLLLHAVGRDRTWLYSHPEEDVPDEVAAQFFDLIKKRASGEPTQHLTGKQEFWGLELEVTPDVLIPRPETEHVIEVALDRLALREARAGRPQKNSGEGLLIADVGTGSGCIAIALAKELPEATFYATDVSPAALVVARRNAARHGVGDRIQFLHCNLLNLPLDSSSVFDSHRNSLNNPRQLDLIVSNPPYVGRMETGTLPVEVRNYEPELALYGGEQGHELYPALISESVPLLKPGGLLILELGHNSLPVVEPLLHTQPHWTHVGVTSDLAGIPRVIAAERSAD